MKILALELSTAWAGLAWLDGSEEHSPYLREWANDRKNSGLFFQNLEIVIKEFGLPGKIIVGLGPGSYAGVRIAISSAIGLQTAGNAELLGYPSVCAMRNDGDEFAVVGDARRQSFYFARISKNEVIEGFELYTEAELKARLDRLDPRVPVVSSDSLPQFDRIEKRHPSAEVLARLATKAGRDFFQPPLEPIYLRAAHVTVPKPIFGVLRS